MKNLNIFFDDAEFEKMQKLKTKLGVTWKEVIARGLKGGKDGKEKTNVSTGTKGNEAKIDRRS